MNTEALSFNDLYIGMKIRVGTGERITHNEQLVIEENTEGVIVNIKGDWFYIHWKDDPDTEPWTSIHSSDTCKLRRL